MPGDRCIPIIDLVAGVSFQYRLDFIIKRKGKFLPHFDILLDVALPLVLGPHESEEQICLKRIKGSRIEGGERGRHNKMC